jgi:hypothetical protein
VAENREKNCNPYTNNKLWKTNIEFDHVFRKNISKANKLRLTETFFSLPIKDKFGPLLNKHVELFKNIGNLGYFIFVFYNTDFIDPADYYERTKLHIMEEIYKLPTQEKNTFLEMFYIDENDKIITLLDILHMSFEEYGKSKILIHLYLTYCKICRIAQSEPFLQFGIFYIYGSTEEAYFYAPCATNLFRPKIILSNDHGNDSMDFMLSGILSRDGIINPLAERIDDKDHKAAFYSLNSSQNIQEISERLVNFVDFKEKLLSITVKLPMGKNVNVPNFNTIWTFQKFIEHIVRYNTELTAVPIETLLLKFNGHTLDSKKRPVDYNIEYSKEILNLSTEDDSWRTSKKIYVNLPTGSQMAVTMETKESVLDLAKKICKGRGYEDVPYFCFRITSPTGYIYPMKTLISDRSIKNDSTIHLFFPLRYLDRISLVVNDPNGTTKFKLTGIMSELSVQDLKIKLFEAGAAAPIDLTISFNGNTLASPQLTLREVGLKNESVIVIHEKNRVVHSSSEIYLENDKFIDPYNTNGNITVREFRGLISKRMEISPRNVLLFFNKSALQDHMHLRDSGIVAKSKIQFVYKRDYSLDNYIIMPISRSGVIVNEKYQIRSGVIEKYLIHKQNGISVLFSEISKRTSIPVADFDLIYNRVPLSQYKDTENLFDREIDERSEIKFVLNSEPRENIPTGAPLIINLKTITGQIYEYRMNSLDTIGDLARKFMNDSGEQRIRIGKGQIYYDLSKTFEYYQIPSGDMLHVVIVLTSGPH